jgi:predicted TIM-barrel fold metal-dependent hydrolase
MAAHIPHTGYYHRALRNLAQIYGCSSTVEDILEHRRARGAEAARRVLAESRVAALLVDTGYPPDAMSLPEMRQLLSCPVHEVFRIEACAEALLARSLPCKEFLEAFRQEVRAAAERCVALKTIIAYRSGLAIARWTPAEVEAAYRRAVLGLGAGAAPRLTEKPLLDTLFVETLEVARASGRPLQIHTGFGDPDIDLLQANPLHLRPFFEDPQWADLRIVLLHMAYPYSREAAFMAAVWPQAYVDLSLAPPFLGPGSIPPLIELLSLAPASKLLYGSDLGGVPEFFALSADWMRAWLGEALGWIVQRSGLSGEEAHRIGRQVFSQNAVALYGLPSC